MRSKSAPWWNIPYRHASLMPARTEPNGVNDLAPSPVSERFGSVKDPNTLSGLVTGFRRDYVYQRRGRTSAHGRRFQHSVLPHLAEIGSSHSQTVGLKESWENVPAQHSLLLDVSPSVPSRPLRGQGDKRLTQVRDKQETQGTAA